VTGKTENELLGSRVGYNNVVEDGRRQPVFSLLRRYDDRCHVRQHWTSRCKRYVLGFDTIDSSGDSFRHITHVYAKTKGMLITVVMLSLLDYVVQVDIV